MAHDAVVKTDKKTDGRGWGDKRYKSSTLDSLHILQLSASALISPVRMLSWWMLTGDCSMKWRHSTQPHGSHQAESPPRSVHCKSLFLPLILLSCPCPWTEWAGGDVSGGYSVNDDSIKQTTTSTLVEQTEWSRKLFFVSLDAVSRDSDEQFSRIGWYLIVRSVQQLQHGQLVALRWAWGEIPRLQKQDKTVESWPRQDRRNATKRKSTFKRKDQLRLECHQTYYSEECASNTTIILSKPSPI